MKTKSLILIAFAAIITLSFSFAASTRSAKASSKETAGTSIDQHANEPIGGFIAEDKF
jgi:hypothetical protein